MTKRNRLFIIFVFLFFLLTPAAILYSIGYRFDWLKGQAIKTGAFYFKVFPGGAEIYIDKEIKKETSFFFNSAFIDNLPQKIYEVEIKKNNYHVWRKNLEIQEQMVTSAKNVFLIPENPSFELLSFASYGDSYETEQSIEDFSFSPDGKELILKVNDIKNGRFLKAIDVQKQSGGFLLEDRHFSEISTSSPATKIKEMNQVLSTEASRDIYPEIKEIKWAGDSKKILLKADSGQKTKYFVLEDDNGRPNLFPLDFLGAGAEQFSFEPGQQSKIFFLRSGDLFEADYSKKTIAGPILNGLKTYVPDSDFIFWFNNEGFLGTAAFSGKKTSVLNREPLSIESGKEYEIIGREPDKIFLKKDGELFFLNFQSAEFEKLSDSVKGVEFSPDEKKIAYFSDYEISIFFLGPEYNQPFGAAGEKTLLAAFPEKIGGLFWLNNHYLLLNTADKIKVSETDNRDRVNIAELPSYLSAASGQLIEVKSPKIFWNEFNQTLYVLVNGDIYFSNGLFR